MMLKKLYEEYDLSIEKIILKEYKRLDLTMKETAVILALFAILKKRRTFSINAISRRVEYPREEIGKIIESLLNKELMVLELEQKDGKDREVFHLDNTFKKLEKIFKQDIQEKQMKYQETNISATITLFEQGLGRLLHPYELENIRKWYDEETFEHERIIEAIIDAKDRVSIKYVERVLSTKLPKKVKIDDDVDKKLDEIFKKIK
jgi:DNA replication protein